MLYLSHVVQWRVEDEVEDLDKWEWLVLFIHVVACRLYKLVLYFYKICVETVLKNSLKRCSGF